jgi:hypothetical protein
MVANLQGKKVQTHKDDEVKYIFIPIEQSYNNNLKNILLWTSSGEEERTWATKVSLVGLFEVDWKMPRHNILVEFLNNSKLDSKPNKIKVMMGEEHKITDKHLLVEVF